MPWPQEYQANFNFVSLLKISERNQLITEPNYTESFNKLSQIAFRVSNCAKLALQS